MADVRSVSLAALGDNLEAAVFLAAGAVLLFATLLFGVGAFTALDTAAFPMHRVTAAGYGLTAAGLAYLFTWFDPPAPRLVRAGGALAGLAVLATLALVALGAVRGGSDRALDPATAMVLAVVALAPLALGVALLGIAMVRRSTLSRGVGWLLFLLSGLWVGLLAANLAYRHEAAFAGWLLPLGGSLMYGYATAAADGVIFAGHAGVALTTLALGYLLWGVDTEADH